MLTILQDLRLPANPLPAFASKVWTKLLCSRFSKINPACTYLFPHPLLSQPIYNSIPLLVKVCSLIKIQFFAEYALQSTELLPPSQSEKSLPLRRQRPLFFVDVVASSRSELCLAKHRLCISESSPVLPASFQATCLIFIPLNAWLCCICRSCSRSLQIQQQ